MGKIAEKRKFREKQQQTRLKTDKANYNSAAH